jgi:hypothetical protein
MQGHSGQLSFCLETKERLCGFSFLLACVLGCSAAVVVSSEQGRLGLQARSRAVFPDSGWVTRAVVLEACSAFVQRLQRALLTS